MRPYVFGQLGHLDDTLWEIAERELGSGFRWTEIRKADGTTFSSDEARRIPRGTIVYLPSGSTAPDESPDSHTPIDPEPIPDDDSTVTNPDPIPDDEVEEEVKEGSSRLEFTLDNASLGIFDNAVGLDLKASFDESQSWSAGVFDVEIGVNGEAGIFGSAGTIDSNLVGEFDYSFTNSGDSILFDVEALGGQVDYFSSVLGVGAGISGGVDVNLGADVELPVFGKLPQLEISDGFEVKAEDFIPGFVSADLGFDVSGEAESESKVKGEDSAGISLDAMNVLPKSVQEKEFFDIKVEDVISLGTAYNATQTSIFDLKGFKFDIDKQDNGNEIEFLLNTGGGTYEVPLETQEIFVQPIVDLSTDFKHALDLDFGASLEPIVDKLIDDAGLFGDAVELALNLGGVNLDLKYEKSIPFAQNSIELFNPYESENYWHSILTV